jgi:hypothetical protein
MNFTDFKAALVRRWIERRRRKLYLSGPLFS